MPLRPRQVVIMVGNRAQVVPVDPRPTCTVKDLLVKKPRKKKHASRPTPASAAAAAQAPRPAAPAREKRAAPHRHRRVFLVASIVLALAAIGAAGAMAWRPAWYAASPVDRARLESDKRDLAALVSNISDALNAGRPAEISLDRAQLNRWLAARRELWPDAELPGWLSEPCVALEQPNRVQVGGLLRLGVLAAVLSVEFSVRADAAYLYINPTDAAVGSLPITTGWALTEVVARGEGQLQRITLDGRPGVKVLNEWVWPNGKVPFCIENLRITADRLSARLVPLRRRS
ncbi:hypothetical protein RAS1_38270 [Phycisphaerae bacterium RAS1]|nr:hypothetical protein RAS1_38270 [Phycisphaerae bacterium RAS1]